MIYIFDFNDTIILLRTLMAITLVVSGANVLFYMDEIKATNSIKFSLLHTPLFIDTREKLIAATLITQFIASIFIFDWSAAKRFVAAAFTKIKMKHLVDICAMAALSAGLILAYTHYVIPWLLSILSEPFLQFVTTALTAGTALLFIGSVALFYISERIALSKIEIIERMSRQQLADALRSLRSEKGRLALIERIHQANITPTGQWPPEFNFTVTSDPAMTELAKLEEHWLGLDR